MKLFINAYLDYTLKNDFIEKWCDKDNEDKSVVTDDVPQSYVIMLLMCVSWDHKHWNKKALWTPVVISQAKPHPELHHVTVFRKTSEAGKKLLH